MATDLETVAAIVQAALIGSLGLIMAVVFRDMVTGRIWLRGMLSRDAGDGRSAVERTALLVATVGYAFFYVTAAFDAPLDGPDPSLPEIPDTVVAVLFGTNGLYLAGKLWGTKIGG